jgi:flavin reductase (DIM6/NTAB) family NADH-FMN oxidoreductase RutF
VGRYFGVSILTEEQEDLSSRFANHAITDRFENLPYDRGQTGVPLLPNSLAWLECRITEAYPGGDHTIFLGAVERAATSAGRPLAFYRGRYARLAPEAEK